MALRTISQFKSNLTGGGVRPNLFEVELNFPNATGSDFQFMSNAATPAAESVEISESGVADKHLSGAGGAAVRGPMAMTFDDVMSCA